MSDLSISEVFIMLGILMGLVAIGFMAGFWWAVLVIAILFVAVGILTTKVS